MQNGGAEASSVDGSHANQALAPIWKAVSDNLGASHASETVTSLPQIDGLVVPKIPPGVATTLVPVPVPVSSLPGATASKSTASIAQQEGELLAVFCLASLVWVLPWLFINRGFCCKCFQKWMSRRLSSYFCLGLLFNLTIVSLVIAREPDISANDIFFGLVAFLEVISDKLIDVLTQVAIVVGVIVALAFRKKIVQLLGFDTQIVRADLKDLLTFFAMKRFHPIEVCVWKMEGLQTGFTSRTVFLRLTLGFNEPQHSRPHDGITASVIFREKLQLNYDPEDDSQKMSIMIKQQEVVGSAVSALAPVAGAIAGAAGGIVTPLGPAAGAGLGVVTGVGAANSLGVEVARVDLSSAMINRIRNASKDEVRAQRMATGMPVPWSSDHFTKVDLVPQGYAWIRIADLEPEQSA